MDYGGECVSIFKLIVTNGQEDQTYFIDWYTEFDWIVTFDKEGQVNFEWEEKGQVMGYETR